MAFSLLLFLASLHIAGVLIDSRAVRRAPVAAMRLAKGDRRT